MKKSETKYIRRTQKDYSMSFKLSVVQAYETSRLSMETIQRKYGIQGSHTLKRWIEKYGNVDVSNKSHCPVEKSKEQQLLELEQKIKLLERKNDRLEKELELKDIKAEFFDMMIDTAEKEYHIDIRKNSFPEQSSNKKKKNP